MYKFKQVRLLWQATAAGDELAVEASECQQLKVSCGAAACRKQDIVNNVLDKKSVCKVERYIQMRSTRIVAYSSRINKYT